MQNSSCASSVCAPYCTKRVLCLGSGVLSLVVEPVQRVRTPGVKTTWVRSDPATSSQTPSPIYFVRTTTPAVPDRRQRVESEKPTLGIWAGWFAFERLGLIRSEKRCLCRHQLTWSCWCCNPPLWWWWSSSSCCDVNMVDAAAWRGG